MTQADSNSEAVIFLHLPKAAGSTLNRLIEWEYPLFQMYSIDPVFFNWSWSAFAAPLQGTTQANANV